MEQTITIIPPKEEYIAFHEGNPEDKAAKLSEWGITDKEFLLYKQNGIQAKVQVVGYEVHGKHNTAIVQFEDGALSCIFPDYLRDMQTPSFGKEKFVEEEEGKVAKKVSAKKTAAKATTSADTKTKPKAEKPKKAAASKLVLPSEKVRVSAKVKEFTERHIPAFDATEEIVLYEEVTILGETPEVIGEGWGGLSKTLKALELSPGDALEFDAKLVDKKFNAEIRCKVNNPSKISKLEQ